MIPVENLHRTSTSPILLKSLMSPLVISTTACRVQASASQSYCNSTYNSMTTFLQLISSGSFFRVASWIHWRRCSTRMYNGPPKWFSWRRSIDSANSASSVMESLTDKEVASTEIIWPGGGTCHYSATNSWYANKKNRILVRIIRSLSQHSDCFFVWFICY